MPNFFNKPIPKTFDKTETAAIITQVETNQASSEGQSAARTFDFNYYITKFFIKNTRLTIMAVMFFIVVATAATLALKTTGFPSPNVPITIINTLYPGASSETVAKTVTIPLESAVKNIKGVKRFSSTSSNSFSNLAITLDETVNVDTVNSQLDSAVKSVVLPTGVESPKLSSISIGGADISLSIFGKNLEETYLNYKKLEVKLAQLPEVSSVKPLREIKEKLFITIDTAKLKESNITIEQIQSKLGTVGEALPVISNVQIDNKIVSLQTSLSKNGLEDLKNLEFSPLIPQTQAQSLPSAQGPGQPKAVIIPSSPAKIYKLSDLAKFEINYSFADNLKSYYSIQSIQTGIVREALTVNIKGIKNTDQAKLVEAVNEAAKKIENTEFRTASQIITDYQPDKAYIVEAYTQNKSSQEQVHEVISGLVGGPLNFLGSAKNLGYALGGIQLVMLVMIALVSWRAAIISALAIPLSFMFSTLFLYLTGDSLNTLTLFSLVLVTGLVVDPALVVLEAIQRKVDSGFKGSRAVLEAVHDVGTGVFLAMLTNIIVFVPFGVLSGIFGQIFKYIPFTVIPAIVGSYLVPLVVLAWLGGLILRKNPKSGDDEIQNLWGVAKWLINLNRWILNLNAIFRFLIIVVILLGTLGLTGAMFGTGKIKVVEFAQSDNVNQLLINGTWNNQTSDETKNKATEEILNYVSNQDGVQTVLQFQSGFSYYVFLKPKSERTITSEQIVQKLNDHLQELYGEKSADQKKFFDLKVGGVSNGGPQSSYQVTVAIKTEDSTNLKKASLDMSKILRDQVCLSQTKAVLDPNCPEDKKLITKVDDGYTDKQNILLDINLEREILLGKQLGALGRAPLTIGINSIIRNEFEINRGEKAAKINYDNREIDVVINQDSPKPVSKQDIKKVIEDKTKTSFDTVGAIIETEPQATINRNRGQTTGLVQARLKKEYQNDRAIAGSVANLITDYYKADNYQKTTDLGLEKDAIGNFNDGSAGDGAKFLSELGIALVLAIIVSYIVLAVFFNSFLPPLSILYTIPLTFLGVFPALYLVVGGQFGFLEIIGLIILIGIVENVAIFLIDGANQKVKEQGLAPKEAIALASGIRLRPVLMTKITTLVSLAPLAITSEFYRSISVVIIFGLLTSGFMSLITTPILYIYFNWLSGQFRAAKIWFQLLFLGSPVIGFLTGKLLSQISQRVPNLAPNSDLINSIGVVGTFLVLLVGVQLYWRFKRVQ